MRFRVLHRVLFGATVVLLDPFSAEAQYTVIPEGSGARGHIWIGDGIAGLYSSNATVANRFRLGAEAHLGDDYQFILGITLFDRFWSGETSASTGAITRRSTDFNLGYFVIPDQLWVMYSLMMVDATGTAVIGGVSILAHQLSVGYRFLSKGPFNLALEAAYTYSPPNIATTVNFSNNATGTVDFPNANILSLNLRIGYDMGS